MKNLLLGTDICQISRIESAVKKHGDRFLNKIFTETEIKYSKSSSVKVYDRLAVRFATKEAVSKALGVGINKMGWNKGINWKEVEISRETLGGLTISLRGKAFELAHKNGVEDWKVTVSHMGDYATATVIGVIQ